MAGKMSKYLRVATQIRNEALLVQALEEVCGELGIEYERGEGLALYGWKGRRRRETAEYVIRRHHIDQAANDMGFRRLPDGGFEAIISAYDQWHRGRRILDQIRQRYACHAVTRAACSQGLTVVPQKSQSGEIRLQLRAYR
jgi:hypothetical protein